MARHDLAYGYDFVEVTSTPSVSASGNFQSDITFEIPQPDGCFIVPKNSYMAVKLPITQVDQAGNVTCLQPIINTGTLAAPTAISVPYIASNPIMNLFQNVKVYFDQQEITNYQNASTLNSLFRILYESKSEQSTTLSTNSINLMSQDDADTTAGVINNASLQIARKISPGNTTLGNLLTNRHLFALKKSI